MIPTLIVTHFPAKANTVDLRPQALDMIRCLPCLLGSPLSRALAAILTLP